MKATTFLLILVTAAAAGTAGWFAARHSQPAMSGDAPSERKILYYQSPMHPHIKSDKPGNCTICGMKLTPVYEGEKGFAVGSGFVTLSTSAVTVINVQMEQIRRRPLVRTLRVAGRIDDDDTRHRFVSAYIDGRIDKLAVNHVGAAVVAGEPLGTFYSPQLLTAEQEYLTLLKEGRRREVNGIGSTALAEEHARLVQSAAQRLRRLGVTDTQIIALADKQESSSQTELRAPITGTVVSRFAYEGQYVKEGEKLFEIGDFSKMWFLFDAYERDLPWVKPGQVVAITTPSVPGKVFTAPIVFVDPNFNEMTRTTRVRVEMENPLIEEQGLRRRVLSHRLFAEGVVKADMPEVLAISRSAVLAAGQNAVAYVALGGGSFQQRTLKLGRMGDDAWEVLEGVSEGEKVVTSGNLLIDAQAQLNQSAETGGVTTTETNLVFAASLPASVARQKAAIEVEKLSAAQESAAKDLLKVVDSLTSSLAADSLDQFNQHTTGIHPAIKNLADGLSSSPAWKVLVERLNSVGHLAAAKDIASARKAFQPLSDATASLVKQLRTMDTNFATVKLYRCPMTNKAFPGAPKTGEWIQLQGPIHNPYFGKEMLDCGTEIKTSE
ncbi:MAG: efflux RND transporter periplasmic adaptor subunit [Pedosphaera sp.]|nr:efflux RND transporter periplasmic adaptor subunit [Pedosphaera sp.]